MTTNTGNQIRMNRAFIMAESPERVCGAADGRTKTVQLPAILSLPSTGVHKFPWRIPPELAPISQGHFVVLGIPTAWSPAFHWNQQLHFLLSRSNGGWPRQ